MALDDAPSVEVEIKDAGTSAPADGGADVSAPVAESPSAEATTEPASPDTSTTPAAPAEPSEAREADGNKDINLEIIKANAEPKINNGQVGAALEQQQSRQEERAERQEKDKEELEAAVDNAREARDGRRREAEEEKQRKEWEGKTHQMGNMEMSGADLDKLLNFMKSPAAIAKVEAAMKAKGASQKQIDKAQKEWKEYSDLKEKEKSGEPLTPQEQKRLQEINKSQEFQQFSQTATEVARNYGVKFSVEHFQQSKDNLANINNKDFLTLQQETKSLQHTSAVVDKKTDVAFEETISSRAVAKAHFPSAPDLTDSFTSSSALPNAQARAPTAANDVVANATIAANTQQGKPKQAALDTSFG